MFLAILTVAACNPVTTRPGFRPLTHAAIDTALTDPPTTLTAIESQMAEHGLAVRRSSARDGYLETRRFDSAPQTSPDDDNNDVSTVVVMRFWVNPVPGDRSQIIAEVVYRRTADPSISDRAAEAMVPPDHPARELLAEVLDAVKGSGRAE